MLAGSATYTRISTPKLPIDSVFQSAVEDENANDKSAIKYIADLKLKMQTTQDIAMKHSDQARFKQRNTYEKRAESYKSDIGDNVPVKGLKHGGNHKIKDKYEQETYEVNEQVHPEIPVFKIMSKSGIEKSLHRNHLLPFHTILVDRRENGQMSKPRATTKKPVPKPRGKPNKQSNGKEEEQLTE